MLNIIIYHGCKPRFVEKKGCCFNNIVSFGLTTNPPKESKGMACDVFLQRIITDSHGASVSLRAIPLLLYFVYGFLHRSFTDIHGYCPCRSVPFRCWDNCD